jgi:DNA-binding CsgD family transcriptional regulator
MRVLFYLLQFGLIYSFVQKMNIQCKHFLTNEQWIDIKTILQNKKTTPVMRDKVNKIIYNHYENYAFYQAVNFKKKHSFKCKHIRVDELFIYSSRGLCKSIQKYNSSYPFIPHVNIYILHELLLGMSELQPISKIPKSRRMYKMNTNMKYSQTTYFGNDEFEVFDESVHKTTNEDMQEYENYWRMINDLNPMSKQIFNYKYDIYFNKIRTNKQVAELMCYSEEYIRQHIQCIKNKISVDKLNK